MADRVPFLIAPVSKSQRLLSTTTSIRTRFTCQCEVPQAPRLSRWPASFHCRAVTEEVARLLVHKTASDGGSEDRFELFIQSAVLALRQDGLQTSQKVLCVN